MVDAGNNAIGALQAHCDLLDVDAVLLSHLHADHCIDLVAYAYARRYHPLGMQPAIPLYGPVGTRQRLVSCFDHPPAIWRVSHIRSRLTACASPPADAR